MNNFNQINESLNIMYSSPLRELVRNEKTMPIVMESGFLEEDYHKLQVILENLSEPLKVVIMGEVKAGKSTLLNAFASDDLSPSNVSEATASILEIKYSEKPYGKIVKENETVDGSPNEIFKIMDDHQNDQAFFSDCQYVQIGYPVANLKNFTLVDTPGLETITTSNSDRTKKYLEKTDVVIWVFNGHHLGQSDVEESLIEVNKYGKPVIAIVNRIDEIDAEAYEIKDFLEEQVGMFVKEIFPLSAKIALEGRKAGDQELIRESGFSDLLEFLDQNIDRKADETKKSAVLQSTTALLNRDILKHEEHIKTIEFIEKQANKINDQTEEYKQSIQRNILREFENWYSREFLEKERSELKSVVNSSGVFDIKKKLKIVEEQISILFSNERIMEQVNVKVNELDSVFEKEWQKAINSISEDTLIQINELTKHSDLVEREADLWSGAAKGAWLGGATGAASAFYAAALGPAAQVVSIGMAASAFLPPLLLIGATFGAVSSFIKVKSEKNQAEKNIDDIIRAIKEDNKKNLISAIECSFNDRGNEVSRNVSRHILSSFSNGVDFEEMTALKIQIEKYLFKLKDQLQQLAIVV